MSAPVTQPDLSAPRRAPLVELLIIAAPTVAQSASYTLMQFIDTWMLAVYGERSGLGNLAPTAANNAGMFMFSLLCLGMGALFVVNALASQSFGRYQASSDENDRRECGRYMWQGVWFGLVFGLVNLPFIPAGNWILGQLHEPELAQLEISYFTICTLFAPLKLISVSVGQFLIAIGRPNQVLMATVVGVLADIFANWLLIFGVGIFPEMGVAGAAWGTNIAVVAELGALALFASTAYVRPFGVKEWRLRITEMRQLIRIGMPAGLQFLADVVPWTIFMNVVIASFGAHAMAANTFMFRYLVTSFLPAMGLGVAVTALVGRSIGRGEPHMAYKFARMGMQLALVYLVALGVLYWFWAEPLLQIFKPDPDVMPMGIILMRFAAVFLLFDGMYIIYNGALRGAGDTFIPAMVTAVLCWSLMVGGAFLVAYVAPQWGIIGPWSIALAYVAIISIFMWLRFIGGRWQRIDLDPSHLQPGHASEERKIEPANA